MRAIDLSYLPEFSHKYQGGCLHKRADSQQASHKSRCLLKQFEHSNLFVNVFPPSAHQSTEELWPCKGVEFNRIKFEHVVNF